MRRYIGYLTLIAIVLLTGLGARPDQVLARDAKAPGFAPDRIIVKLEKQAPAGTLEEVNRKKGARTEEKLSRLRLSVVELPEDLPVAEAVEAYEEATGVEYAEPDYEIQAEGIPNDASYSSLWDLENTGQDGGTPDADIDAPGAWDVTTGNPGTVVAVLDTGIDINHPDLKNNVWTNPDEVPGNNVDDDGNGYVDDVNGWDFRNDDASVYDAADGDKHGTHVAGTIAAEGNNGIGISGVNWRAAVMPLKFLGPTGGYSSDAIEAIDYAVANGAQISNNSWGMPFSQAVLDAIKRADAAGHLFITSAGNKGENTDAIQHYPSGYDSPNVVSVAASDQRDSLATFAASNGASNYGATSVDLAAPGDHILSTLPGNAYGYYEGTSMAAPHVAGAAVLLKGEYPELDDAGIKARLLDSVDKKTSLTGKTLSGGRLNVAGAISAGPGVVAPPAPTVMSVSPADGATGVGRAANITATFSEAIDPATLTTSAVTLTNTKTGAKVAAALKPSLDGKTLTLDPSTNLAVRTRHKVAIAGGTGGVEGLMGNALTADEVWYFTTGKK